MNGSPLLNLDGGFTHNHFESGFNSVFWKTVEKPYLEHFTEDTQRILIEMACTPVDPLPSIRWLLSSISQPSSQHPGSPRIPSQLGFRPELSSHFCGFVPAFDISRHLSTRLTHWVPIGAHGCPTTIHEMNWNTIEMTGRSICTGKKKDSRADQSQNSLEPRNDLPVLSNTSSTWLSQASL